MPVRQHVAAMARALAARVRGAPVQQGVAAAAATLGTIGAVVAVMLARLEKERAALRRQNQALRQRAYGAEAGVPGGAAAGIGVLTGLLLST